MKGKTKSISSRNVDEAIKQCGPVCEEQLVDRLIEQFSVSDDQVKSAITDAMMEGLVFRNLDGDLDRSGIYGPNAEWK